MDKKKGFTLIELLATIVIVALVFIITGVLIFNKKDVVDRLDAAQKKLILNSASDFVNEFRNRKDNWIENVSDDGASFCISLNSLIDLGFFKSSSDEYITKNKDKLLVSVKVDTNQVYSYEIVETKDSSTYCNYTSNDSSLNRDSGSIDILDDNEENTIGNLKYVVNKNQDESYDVDINFLAELGIDIVQKKAPVYVAIVLDNSGSMDGTKWNNAKEAAKELSNTIIGDLKGDAQIALVQFDLNPKLSREFKNEVLIDSNFIVPNGNTNVSGGLDLTSSLYKALSDIPDNAMLYTILLYDGQPEQTSYLLDTTSNKNIYNSNQATFYKYFLGAYSNSYKLNNSNNKYTFDKNDNYKLSYYNSDSITYVSNAAKYLKETVESKLITIGYGWSGGNSLKEISSSNNESNDEFCLGSDYSTNTYKYDEKTMNDIEIKKADLTYPFKYNESDGSLISTNVEVNTESYGIYELDLSDSTKYKAGEEVEVEIDYELSRGSSYNFIYILINEKDSRTTTKYSKYNCYSNGWSNLNYCSSSTATTKVNVEAGKKYYIHLYYIQNGSANQTLKINKISYSVVSEDKIYDNIEKGYNDKFYLSTEEESKIVFEPKVSDNKLLVSTNRIYTTAGGYKELDLKGKTGKYLLTINAESKAGRGTIYISKNSYPPQSPVVSHYDSYSYYYYVEYNGFNSKTVKRMFDSSKATNFNFLIDGDEEYYIHFINDIRNTSSYSDNFTINSMSLVKIGDELDAISLEDISSDECVDDNLNNISCLKKSPTYDYGFKYSNGSIFSTNTEIANSCSHSYIEVNLENKSSDEYFVISFNSLVSSESRYDFGNIVITDNPNSPTTTSSRYCNNSNENNECVTISSGSTSTEAYSLLQGGKKYYIHFTYCKDSSSNDGNDYFAINKINMYDGIDSVNYDFNDVVSYKNYSFDKQEDKSLISTNKGVINTKSHRYIKIDLDSDGYNSNDRFLLEVDNFVSSNNNASLYLTSSSNYPATDSSVWYTNYSADTTFKEVITGGKVYYLHFVYTKSSNSNNSKYEDIYRIDGVRVKKYVNDSVNKVDLSKDLSVINNYYFVKDGTSYTSNIESSYSSAYSYFELDLNDYSSSQTLNLNFNITANLWNSGEGKIYITNSSNVPSFYSSSTKRVELNSSGTKDYTVSLNGGTKYYVHMLQVSSSAVKNMIINSISLEEKTVDKTNYYCYYNANVDNIKTVFSKLSTLVTTSVPKLSAKKADIILTTKIDDSVAFHIEDKDKKLVDKITIPIDLTSTDKESSSYNIELNDKYKFKLDSEVKCPSDSDKEQNCELELKLFNINLILYYDDGKTKTVELDNDLIPTVTIKIESGKAVN